MRRRKARHPPLRRVRTRKWLNDYHDCINTILLYASTYAQFTTFHWVPGQSSFLPLLKLPTLPTPPPS